LPETSRWILTTTFCRHAVNPSLTTTSPEVTRCLASRRETVRWWVGPTTVKLVELVAVPPGPVTEINPVVAPTGTVAVILVEEFTTKDAVTLLKRTAVAPVKFVPVIVTEVPTGPEVGENEVIVGAATTVKLVVLVAVPFRLVTEMGPEAAPGGTVAVICVDEFTVKDAEVLLNLTPVTLVKFVPKMLTEVPTAPLVGENDVMVGAAATGMVKFVELVAVPLGLVTAIGPVKAPEGTMAVIWVDEFTVKVADVFLNLTSLTLMKFVPVMLTEVATGPLVGENEVIVGAPGAVTEKFAELRAVPFNVVTEIFPDVASGGTVAVICVGELTVNGAGAFLKLTPVTSMKFVPTIVTTVPTDPEVGENDMMVGGSAAAAGTATPTTSTVATARLRARRQPIFGLRALPPPLSEVRLVSCAFCTPKGGASATPKWPKKDQRRALSVS